MKSYIYIKFMEIKLEHYIFRIRVRITVRQVSVMACDLLSNSEGPRSCFGKRMYLFQVHLVKVLQERSFLQQSVIFAH